MFEVDLTVADSGEGSGATAEGALARLLRCGVDSLPASITRRQVWTSHPAVVPHVEVPSGKDLKVRLRVIHVMMGEHHNVGDQTYQIESALR